MSTFAQGNVVIVLFDNHQYSVLARLALTHQQIYSGIRIQGHILFHQGLVRGTYYVITPLDRVHAVILVILLINHWVWHVFHLQYCLVMYFLLILDLIPSPWVFEQVFLLRIGQTVC